jgi:hypothetical protein
MRAHERGRRTYEKVAGGLEVGHDGSLLCRPDAGRRVVEADLVPVGLDPEEGGKRRMRSVSLTLRRRGETEIEQVDEWTRKESYNWIDSPAVRRRPVERLLLSAQHIEVDHPAQSALQVQVEHLANVESKDAFARADGVKSEKGGSASGVEGGSVRDVVIVVDKVEIDEGIDPGGCIQVEEILRWRGRAETEEGVGGMGVSGVLGVDRDGGEKLGKAREEDQHLLRAKSVAKKEGGRTEPEPAPVTPTRSPTLRTPAPFPWPARRALRIWTNRSARNVSPEIYSQDEPRRKEKEKAHVSVSGRDRSGKGDRRGSEEEGGSKGEHLCRWV